MKTIPVKLQVFEGPLDLLMHLIERNKLNIYDIPIVEITNQYLQYVNEMERKDLDMVSEFLLMAATLLDIKSRMLLPKETNEEGETEDPRDELVQKLLEYKMYKYMAEELKDRQIDAEKSFFKEADIPEEVAKYQPPVDVDKLFEGVTLAKLNEIFVDVMKRKKDKSDPIRSKFGKIQKEEVSLPDKISYIKTFMKQKRTFRFRELMEKQASKTHVIVSFLAILELMKTGEIIIEQKDLFGDIVISPKPLSVSISH